MAVAEAKHLRLDLPAVATEPAMPQLASEALVEHAAAIADKARVPDGGVAAPVGPAETSTCEEEGAVFLADVVDVGELPSAGGGRSTSGRGAA